MPRPTPLKYRQPLESALSVLFPGGEPGKTQGNGSTNAESADERHWVIRCGETTLVWPAFAAPAAVGHGARERRGEDAGVGALTGETEVGVVGRVALGRVWRKSSHSGGDNTDCVEVAVQGAHVLVRDSKRRTGPVLVFRRTAWCGLLAGLKDPAVDGF
ncbi:DUF397 domain-containing protein [Streptomyces sp. NPDC002513]